MLELFPVITRNLCYTETSWFWLAYEYVDVYLRQFTTVISLILWNIHWVEISLFTKNKDHYLCFALSHYPSNIWKSCDKGRGEKYSYGKLLVVEKKYLSDYLYQIFICWHIFFTNKVFQCIFYAFIKQDVSRIFRHFIVIY